MQNVTPNKSYDDEIRQDERTFAFIQFDWYSNQGIYYQSILRILDKLVVNLFARIDWQCLTRVFYNSILREFFHKRRRLYISSGPSLADIFISA